jgi:hypothetical protein
MKDNDTPAPRRRASSSGRKRRAYLLGLIIEKDDGHKRITRAEQFTLVGGSEASHEAVTEGVTKTCEDLKRKGRELEETDPREVRELLQKNIPKR